VAADDRTAASRAEQAFGAKLAAYCLNPDNEIGGPKAEGFRRILGIELADLEYPTEALREHRDRTVAVTTSWELRHSKDAPRSVTAYIDG
jgi:hypothetical protein